MSFAGTSTGCLLLLALAGCVSSDGSLTTRNLDQAGVTAGSSAAAVKEDASTADGANPETKAAAAEVKDGTEEAGSAPALAMAAKAPQSPALVAANSAVSDTGVAVPTPSPNADADNTQPAAAKSATANADEASSPVETASVAAQPSGAGDAADEAEQKQGFPLFRLFSSNRAGKQAHSGHSVSSRGNETAAKTTQTKETASDEKASSPDTAGIDQIEVASVDDEHEEYEEYEPMESLPGVRLKSLYSLSQDGDADGRARIQLASAAGMGRFSSGFLVKQRETVQTACLKPALLGLLKRVQYHFDAPVMITSGYRGKKHNRRVGGVSRSKHMTCEAADIQVEGVSKWQLAKYVRSIPGRGGVGTYCHTNSVHVDIGRKRDWNWRCRRGK